jgi:hypothetical protein
VKQLAALIGTDVVSLVTTFGPAVFADKNVGDHKLVTVGDATFTLSGANAGNYLVKNFADPLYANITKADITITAVTNSKIYDGTISAANKPDHDPLKPGDSFAVLKESYDNKNVGSGKTLTPYAEINDGNKGNNYNVTLVSNNTGVISRAPLVVSGGSNAPFDGNSGASNQDVRGLLNGDTFRNKPGSYPVLNVGFANTFNANWQIDDGNDGNNYVVSFIPTFKNSIIYLEQVENAIRVPDSDRYLDSRSDIGDDTDPPQLYGMSGRRELNGVRAACTSDKTTSLLSKSACLKMALKSETAQGGEVKGNP